VKERENKEFASHQITDIYRVAAQMRDQGISEQDAKVLMMRHEAVTGASIAASTYQAVATVYADDSGARPQQYYDMMRDACMEYDVKKSTD